jgi:hypothetical protein
VTVVLIIKDDGPSIVYGPFPKEQDAVDWCWEQRDKLIKDCTCEVVELTKPESSDATTENS